MNYRRDGVVGAGQVLEFQHPFADEPIDQHNKMLLFRHATSSFRLWNGGLCKLNSHSGDSLSLEVAKFCSLDLMCSRSSSTLSRRRPRLGPNGVQSNRYHVTMLNGYSAPRSKPSASCARGCAAATKQLASTSPPAIWTTWPRKPDWF